MHLGLGCDHNDQSELVVRLTLGWADRLDRAMTDKQAAPSAGGYAGPPRARIFGGGGVNFRPVTSVRGETISIWGDNSLSVATSPRGDCMRTPCTK